jgi:hypothetical protein
MSCWWMISSKINIGINMRMFGNLCCGLNGGLDGELDSGVTIRSSRKKSEFNDILELLQSKNKPLIKDIEEFSKKEYSYDILVFIQRVILFKKSRLSVPKVEMANKIFKEFVELKGQRSLTLSKKMIRFVERKLSENPLNDDLFDHCVVKCRRDFADIFNRWKNT